MENSEPYPSTFDLAAQNAVELLVKRTIGEKPIQEMGQEGKDEAVTAVMEILTAPVTFEETKDRFLHFTFLSEGARRLVGLLISGLMKVWEGSEDFEVMAKEKISQEQIINHLNNL